MPLIHAFSSSKADGADPSQVQPSNWNAAHRITSGGLQLDAVTSGSSAQLPGWGTGTFFTRERALKVNPGFIGPSGMDYALMPHIGVTKIYHQTANGAATTYSTYGGAAATATGTATTNTVASTNFSSSLRRVDHPSAATAGSSAGLRGPAAYYWRGSGTHPEAGGFYGIFRGIVAVTATTNTRMFVGFNTSTANPTNVDPVTIFNMVGVGKDAADTAYQFYWNDGTGNATKYSTGITMVQGDVYEIRVFTKPSGTDFGLSLEIISVGGTGTALPAVERLTTGSTDIPALTTFLNWHAYMQTSTTTAVRHAIISVYTETDN